MIARSVLLSAALAAIVTAGLGASPARADVFDDLQVRIGLNVGRPRAVVERVWIEPVYETRCERVWVEPVFEDRCERVWHEPVYEDRCERVLVPDRFETRRETLRDYNGRRYTREVRVLVEPAHYEERQARVVVRAGHWEEVPRRVCVSEGRWTEVSRAVVVREGYWTEQTVAYDRGGSGRIDIDLGRERRDDRGDDRHDPRGDGRQNADYRPARESAYRTEDRRGSDRGGDDRIARAHDQYARDRGDDADHGDRAERRPREDRGKRY